MIGGVAGGVAEYLRVDVAIVRIVLLVLLFTGPGFIVYLIGWIAIPEAPERFNAPLAAADVESPPPTSASTDAPDSGRWLIGAVLVAIGGWMLIRNIADDIVPWLDDVILPLALIGVGTAVAVYAVKK
jgi:phage shock protein PspC (stress-responsive transcriptional regulator)